MKFSFIYFVPRICPGWCFWTNKFHWICCQNLKLMFFVVFWEWWFLSRGISEDSCWVQWASTIRDENTISLLQVILWLNNYCYKLWDIKLYLVVWHICDFG
jgi:hypothetical protein